MDPINYNIDVMKPYSMGLQGVQNGITYAKTEDEIQASQLGINRTAQMRNDLALLAQKPVQTAQDYTNLMLQYPELAEHLKGPQTTASSDDQKRRMNTSVQALSAIKSGRMDLVNNLLDPQLQAAKKAGDAQQVQHIQTIKSLINLNPSQAANSIALSMAASVDPKEFTQVFSGVLNSQANAEKIRADIGAVQASTEKTQVETGTLIGKSQSDIEASQAATARSIAETANIATTLAFEKDKVKTNVLLELEKLKQQHTNLPETSITLMNKSSSAETDDIQDAQDYRALAQKIRNELLGKPISAGTEAQIKEWLKDKTGDQDYITSLRGQIRSIYVKLAKDNMSSGPQTDADQRVASLPLADLYGNPENIIKTLEYAASVKDNNAAVENAKMNWIAANRTLGPATQDIVVNGLRVAKGSTVNDYFAANSKKQASNQQFSISTRSYGRHGR